MSPLAGSKRASRRPPARRQGITLLETAAVVSVSSILLAAFVPTFLRHVRLSKISEAVDQLDSLYRGAAAYYAQEHMVAGRRVHGCLPDSVGPLPATPSADQQVVDFDAAETPAHEIWNALGQTGEQPLRYSYQVIVTQPGCGPRATLMTPAVTFRALGDLDGDGTFSTLERSAVISPDQRSLTPTGPLHVRQRVE